MVAPDALRRLIAIHHHRPGRDEQASQHGALARAADVDDRTPSVADLERPQDGELHAGESPPGRSVAATRVVAGHYADGDEKGVLGRGCSSPSRVRSTRSSKKAIIPRIRGFSLIGSG